MMPHKPNNYLIAGGSFSLIAAIMHIFIIIGGPDWYRFFGAGEGMAQLAEKGSSYPSTITLIIAATLALWALYAFSGAGIIRKLPLLKVGIISIATIYLLT